MFIAGTRSGQGTVLNGAKRAPALEFVVGVTHRLRLINVTTGNPAARFQLVREDTSLVQWTRLAKDAIDLPPARRIAAASRQGVSMGETYDMLFTPGEGGAYRLEVRNAVGLLLAHQPIRVVPPR